MAKAPKRLALESASPARAFPKAGQRLKPTKPGQWVAFKGFGDRGNNWLGRTELDSSGVLRCRSVLNWRGVPCSTSAKLILFGIVVTNDDFCRYVGDYVISEKEAIRRLLAGNH